MVPYIAFQSDTERSNPCDLKAYGRPGVIRVGFKARNGPTVLDYAHIPMYATIEGISAYVRGYRGKGRVYHLSNGHFGQ